MAYIYIYIYQKQWRKRNSEFSASYTAADVTVTVRGFFGLTGDTHKREEERIFRDLFGIWKKQECEQGRLCGSILIWGSVMKSGMKSGML